MAKYDWDAIKAKVDIASVIGQVVSLKKKGPNLEGCCPFHQEKTPSFKVFADHYHCFGCSAHGDVVDFVMAMDNCSAADAIQKLGAGEIKMDSQTQKIVNERKAEQEKARVEAIKLARVKWDEAEPATKDHPYIVAKQIEPHNARVRGDRLLLPVYNREGEIQSIQGIGPDGEKIFMMDAPMAGGRLYLGIAIGRTIICEGFATGASIFESVSDRVAIAFSSSGVKDLVREMHEEGRDIAIAADRTGLADYIALGKELGIPVFAPPSGFDDFNDLVCANGHEEAREILRGEPLQEKAQDKPAAKISTPANDEATPLDIWSRNAPPPLPTGMLPPIIERWATARGHQIGCDPGGLAMSALACAAAAIPDTIKVKVKRNEKWFEEARLWVMMVGMPSSKKSPMMRAAAGVIRRIDSDMLRDHQQKLADWKTKKANGIEEAKPEEERLRIEDTTMEAAQEVLKTSPMGVLALQDELSGWFGGIEKYAAGKGGQKDRSFWLQAFNGGPYTVDRISRGSFEIPNLSVSILGAIQPDALRRVCEDATDDGLIQRFIPVILQKADRGNEGEGDGEQEEYENLIHRLRYIRAKEGLFGQMPMMFDDEAQQIRYEYEGTHFDWVCALEGVSPRYSAHIGKFDGILPRIALIFHCIENANADLIPEHITGDTMRRAARFLHEYVLAQSKAFYHGVLGLSPDQDTLENVAGYILAHNLDRLTPRTFARGSRFMRKLTKWNIVPICEQLEAMGWIEAEDRTKNDALAYKVNPYVHQIFAEKAEIERTERLEQMEMIKDLVGSGKAA